MIFQLKKAKGQAAVNIKKRAMQVLKRKKMFEQQRDSMQAQSFNLEQASQRPRSTYTRLTVRLTAALLQTIFAVDCAKDTIETVAAMKGAASAMKVQTKQINIDDIEDVQDELADMMLDMNEVQESLGRSYGVGDEIDESELDDELAALEDEWEEEDAVADSTPAWLQPAAPSAMPDAPAAAAAVGPSGVDEFGLPVAPTMGRAALA
jgi:charged multivesicular body protein 5